MADVADRAASRGPFHFSTMPKKPADDDQPKKLSSYTIKLDDAQMEKLRSICEARGWAPFAVAYSRFAFKADHLKLNITAYRMRTMIEFNKRLHHGK